MLSVKVVVHQGRPVVTESSFFLCQSFASSAARTLCLLHEQGELIRVRGLRFDRRLGITHLIDPHRSPNEFAPDCLPLNAESHHELGSLNAKTAEFAAVEIHIGTTKCAGDPGRSLVYCSIVHCDISNYLYPPLSIFFALFTLQLTDNARIL